MQFNQLLTVMLCFSRKAYCHPWIKIQSFSGGCSTYRVISSWRSASVSWIPWMRRSTFFYCWPNHSSRIGSQKQDLLSVQPPAFAERDVVGAHPNREAFHFFLHPEQLHLSTFVVLGDAAPSWNHAHCKGNFTCYNRRGDLGFFIHFQSIPEVVHVLTKAVFSSSGLENLFPFWRGGKFCSFDGGNVLHANILLLFQDRDILVIVIWGLRNLLTDSHF